MKKLVLVFFLFLFCSCHTYEYRMRQFNLALDKAFDTIATLRSGDTLLINDTIIILK